MNTEISTSNGSANLPGPSPWLTVAEAADRARCGTRSIYSAVSAGTLRAARLGGRRELRFLPEWVDSWLLATSTPIMVSPALDASSHRS